MFENDYTIQGKHATFIKYLVKDAGVFPRYIDVYMTGAALGIFASEEGRGKRFDGSCKNLCRCI